jgi:hypothetical protein
MAGQNYKIMVNLSVNVKSRVLDKEKGRSFYGIYSENGCGKNQPESEYLTVL